MHKTSSPSNNPLAEELARSSANLSRVTQALGVNYKTLKGRFGTDGMKMKSASGPEPQDLASLARPKLRRCVIAVKRAGGDWPDKFADVIKRAQVNYDRGTHEMTTGVKDGWVILYSIPRKVPTTPRSYFSQRGQ